MAMITKLSQQEEGGVRIADVIAMTAF